MKLLESINGMMSKNTSNLGLKFEKAKPDIYLYGGIVGVVGAAVLSCRATLKAENVIDKYNQDMELIEKATEVASTIDETTGKPYDEDYNPESDKKIVYTKTAWEFVKLYAPSVALGALSIASIVHSSNIMKDRYLGAVAAYNLVSSAFTSYRDKVKEELGEDKDRDFRYGLKAEIIEEEVEDDKGKKKKVKKEVKVMDDEPNIVYARVFDESNPNWCENPSFGLTFLKAQQQMANDILQTRGYVFLNELYDMLGFKQTPEGQIVGWLKNNRNNDVSDGHIDFGLFDLNRENVRNYINRKDTALLLDFNVDGIVFDQIGS